MAFDESFDHSKDEEILFTHFMSDYDPSLILLLTYNKSQNVSFLKFLKMFNKNE